MYSPAASAVPLKVSGIVREPPVFQLIRAVKNRWPLAGPPPVVEETFPEPLAEAPPPAAAAVPLPDSEAPEPAPPPVQQIIRQIKTVLIEVPLCENPPGLDGTPSFTKAHVNLQLIKSRSHHRPQPPASPLVGSERNRRQARQRPKGLQPQRRRRLADRAATGKAIADAERPASPGRGPVQG